MIYFYHFTLKVTSLRDRDYFSKGEYFMVFIYKIFERINCNFRIYHIKNYSIECRLDRGAIAPFCSPFASAFFMSVDKFLEKVSVEKISSGSTIRNRPYAEGARRVLNGSKLRLCYVFSTAQNTSWFCFTFRLRSTAKRLKWHDQLNK
jgi:hypothetical protein